MRRELVLDTSVFVNPASSTVFGTSPTEALTRFLDIARGRDDLRFLVPPSIYVELMHFAEEAKIPKDFLIRLEQRAPRKHETRVPGMFLYTLVESMRERVDRGLRLAERHVREALQTPRSGVASPNGKPVREDIEAIGRLRESYRRILREGMLDSRADVDLLLLAYELNATLVSADMGVLAWAESLGLSILPYDQLPAFLATRPDVPAS